MIPKQPIGWLSPHVTWHRILLYMYNVLEVAISGLQSKPAVAEVTGNVGQPVAWLVNITPFGATCLLVTG